ncbi:LacI family transcriptional regulator [Variovorax sp. WS11]|uniref:Bug family tripartite tricarboxylate transporter substrate binding protein n=1 Tax=Variovorax sp. WS11 TaxID=1105204 RepID=UPI000D0CC09A|nr:tripartite tricarboxylate transporter substrate binding protein [Variovorax sp. WS11]NDZ17349.1 tripartite tricarboxylate transporter substrate binding protein [Variovorax sp. WS11]PSL86111.1 LacI family transcriptional regulator [Variovorax sp. WS11]
MFVRSLAALLALCTALGAVTAHAETYPSRPVTIVVPGGAAGAVDSVARVFAQYLGQQIGQPVVIENRAGAGGNIGTEVVAKAPRDGYTLLMAASSAQTINPVLYSRVPFDPIKDFEPIGLIATAPYALVVNPKLPVSTVGELVALAKKQPLYYGSAGNGSLNHLLAEMLKSSAGIEMTHVPYKAVASAAADTVSGQVQVLFGSLPGVLPLARSGQLRAIAVATPQRSKLAPELPAITETVPGCETTAWYGLMAPAGTPRPVLDKLQSATGKVLASKEFSDALANQGVEPMGSTPQQFKELIVRDLAMWSKVVKTSGAKID